MFWARMTFFAVMGKNAPALTVASLTINITSRPCTRARPVTTPADGAPPHSSYMPHATNEPISKNSVPGSMSNATRSRAVRRPFLCCDSIAFAPPPCWMISSSLRTCATSSATAFWLRSKRGESVFTCVSNVDPECGRWSVIFGRSRPSTIKQGREDAQCGGNCQPSAIRREVRRHEKGLRRRSLSIFPPLWRHRTRMPIAGPGMALESTRGWSEVVRAVQKAGRRQQGSKRHHSGFPIWNGMPSPSA